MGLKANVKQQLKQRRNQDIPLHVNNDGTIKGREAEAAQPTNKASMLTTKQIVDLVLKFMEMLTGRNLYPYQIGFSRRIVTSILTNDGATITALFSRQSGKTEAVAQVAATCAILLPVLANQPAFAFDPRFNRYWTDTLGNQKYSGLKNGMLIGIYAPIDEQAKTAFNRIREFLTSDRAAEILNDNDFQMGFDSFNGRNITIKGPGIFSLIGAYSASEGANVESKTYHLVIADEAQDISDYKLAKSISPFLAYNNGTMVQIGTPGLHKGTFYRNVESNKKRHREGGRQDHFEYDYRYVQQQNPQYKKHVAAEITRLGGTDNDEFRMNFMLKWLMDRGMFIEEDKFMACGRNYDIDTPGAGFVVAGIDWAQVIDSTVVTIIDVDRAAPDALGRHSKRILAWAEFHGVAYMEQCKDIVEAVERFGVQLILSDETGVGKMPVEVLKTLVPKTCEVKGVNLTKKQFQTDLWQNLATEFMTGRIVYPNSPEAQKDTRYKNFYQQFVDLEKDTSKGYLTCHAPEGKGYHDDYCLSQDTEILTLRGWIGRTQMQMSDRVAKWIGGHITFVKPDRIIDKDYEGEMLLIEGKYFSSFVTPEHKMGYYKPNGSGFVFSESEAQILKHSRKMANNSLFASAGILKHVEQDIEGQNLRALAYNVLYDEIDHIPRDVLNASWDTLKRFWGYIAGREKDISFTSKHKQLLLDLQELCVKIGKKSILTGSRQGNTGLWRIDIHDGTLSGIDTIKTVEYKGRVWCVTVNNGFIMTRHNNKIAVVGNCDSLALANHGADSVSSEIAVVDFSDDSMFSDQTAHRL